MKTILKYAAWIGALSIAVLFFACEDTPTVNYGDQWVEKDTFPPGQRDAAVAFALAGKGYLLTGWYDEYKSDVWEYDPAEDIWSAKANFPGSARFRAVAFAVGGKAYVATGGYFNNNTNEYTFFNDLWEYDPAHDQWTRKADFPGTPRDQATVFTVGEKAYIGLGRDAEGEANDFWEYTPGEGYLGGQWRQIADFGGNARTGAIGFSVAEMGFAGLGASTQNQLYSDVWQYNPATNKWTRKSFFPGGGRKNAVAFSIGERVFVGTGWIGDGVTNDLWEYDALHDSYSPRSDFPGQSRSAAVAFSVGTNGYIGFGFADADLWQYIPPNQE